MTDLRGYIRSESIDLEESETSTSESLDMAGQKRKSASKSGPSNSKKTKSGKEDETTKTGPYDPNFVNIMNERFISEPDYKNAPKNLAELKEAMKDQRNLRPVPEVTEEDLDDLRAATSKSKNERGVDRHVFSKIEGPSTSAYVTAIDQSCNQWADLLFDEVLSIPKPDIMGWPCRDPRDWFSTQVPEDIYCTSRQRPYFT